MALQLRCPNCGKILRVSDRLLGRTAPCPNCKSPITVPIPSDRRRAAEAVPPKAAPRPIKPAQQTRLCDHNSLKARCRS